MATSRRSSGTRAAKQPSKPAKNPSPAAKVVAKPAKAAKAAKLVVPTKPAEPAKPAKAAKPAAKAAKLAKPASKPSKASKASGKGNPTKAAAVVSLTPMDQPELALAAGPLIEVRRIHRRDINRVWEFLKVSFRDVNAETVEYQRPRSKHRFEEIYEEEGVQQLLFEVDGQIVAYAECSYEVTGSDNWINPRYFEKRDMRPMFIDELAVHPEWHGRGVGSFVLEQLHHLARVNGLTHLVLEVAENNENALAWYKKRSFRKLDAAIFMACALDLEPELLPPRALPTHGGGAQESDDGE
jgi:ribosomal protein S18 acetylase RimI-like enzyme